MDLHYEEHKPDCYVHNQCCGPGCHERDDTGKTFKTCNRCKHAIYCSEACQKHHWKDGHREDCVILTQKMKEASQVGRV